MDRREAAAFVDALEQLIRIFQRVATAGELSLATAAVLARLAREGPQTISVLASAESVSQPNMTQLVNRLEREGLAQKFSGEVDRRTVLVKVTTEGKRVVRQRRSQRAAALRELIADLPEADAVQISRSLPALIRLVESMGVSHFSRKDETPGPALLG